MLIRVKYHLQYEFSLSSRSASLFQGALMQRIDPAYGAVLHRSELKPYSQYVDCGAGQAMWVLQTLTDEAAQLTEAPGLSEGYTIYLEHNDHSLQITSVERECLTQDELLQQTFFAQCPNIIKIKFLTPTAFKVQGRYQNYPTIRHIFGSLVQKYDAANTQTEIAGEGLLDELDRFVAVFGYHLRSTSFSVEGIRIPAFSGELLLKIHGPQQLVNLVHLLLRFGTYSGVGIKTAMGMGALQMIERRDQQK